MADVARTATGQGDPAAPDDVRSAALVLTALAIAGLVVSVMQTLALPLLPEFMRAFHTSVSAVTWVFTATLLAGAVATPLLSRFGDMYGKKKMHVGGGRWPRHAGNRDHRRAHHQLPAGVLDLGRARCDRPDPGQHAGPGRWPPRDGSAGPGRCGVAGGLAGVPAARD